VTSPAGGLAQQRRSLASAAAALRDGRPVLVAGIDGEGALVATAAARLDSQTLVAIGELGGDLTVVAVGAEQAARAGLVALPGVTRARGGLVPAVPVDAVDRLGEAGSPDGRVRTIRTLADPGCEPGAITSPGHVHTAIVSEGGGEAPALALELAWLADCGPALALCPAVDAAGRPLSLNAARRQPPLAGLPCAPALELRSRAVTRELERSDVECFLPTPLGAFRAVALTHGEEQVALALVYGDPAADPGRAIVHTHAACMLGDTFGSLLCDCRERLLRATREIAAAGSGVVVYLRAAGEDPFSCPAGRPVDPSLALGVLAGAGLPAGCIAA
jgi:3,4-dihydroxy 2-butanone 4-phosphate synthase/GTP cyclohydrolase II